MFLLASWYPLKKEQDPYPDPYENVTDLEH